MNALPDNDENEVRFTMRMEKDLYERLKASALKNRRSVAKELEHITEEYLDYFISKSIPNDVWAKLRDKLLKLD